LLSTLLTGVFPGSKIPEIKEFKLREELARVCEKRNYLPSLNFMEKVL
jgi:dynein heavy chain 1